MGNVDASKIITGDPIKALREMGCQGYGLREGWAQFETRVTSCLDIQKDVFDWLDDDGKAMRIAVEIITTGIGEPEDGEYAEYATEYVLELL